MDAPLLELGGDVELDVSIVGKEDLVGLVRDVVCAVDVGDEPGFVVAAGDEAPGVAGGEEGVGFELIFFAVDEDVEVLVDVGVGAIAVVEESGGGDVDGDGVVGWIGGGEGEGGADEQEGESDGFHGVTPRVAGMET